MIIKLLFRHRSLRIDTSFQYIPSKKKKRKETHHLDVYKYFISNERKCLQISY